MICDKCKYNGGFIKVDTTYSGLHHVCNAPEDHIRKCNWTYIKGATLQGHHCCVEE